MPFEHKWNVSEVFDDIILGRGVKRAVHSLEFDGEPLSKLFVERLRLYKYRPVALREIVIDASKRAPAFYLLDNAAIFGHVFWEVFPDNNRRKLWGSVVRNEKGDWKYILPANSAKVVYVNMDKQEDVDLYYSG